MVISRRAGHVRSPAAAHPTPSAARAEWWRTFCANVLLASAVADIDTLIYGGAGEAARGCAEALFPGESPKIFNVLI